MTDASGDRSARSIDLSPLWEPVSIGALEIGNRICVPAHQTHFAQECGNLIGERYAEYVLRRARGGAGLIILEAGGVHPSTRKAGLLELYRSEIIPGMKKLTSAVHQTETKIFAQLSHLGSQDLGTSLIDDWHPVVAPSAVPSPVYGRVPVALDPEQIANLVRGYGDAAANAADGGVDGFEISAGHGYLLCQFLSPLTNKRADGYGGSTANRCRIIVEIGAEIRRRTGSLPVGVRLSFDEFVGEAGIVESEAQEIVSELHRAALFDYISVTAGNYHTVHQWVPPSSSGKSGHLADFGALARAAVLHEIPVIVSSAIRTIERAAEMVGAGEADLAGMARAHIADPRLVAKARAGQDNEIRRCIGANQGCLRRAMSGLGITCTVNPTAAREGEHDRVDPRSRKERRRVLIAGGGPAGMQLAEAAARDGNEVVLFERNTFLGGQLLIAALLPGRESWIELADDLARSLDRHGVEVHLGREATPATVTEAGADQVYVATGSAYDRSGYSIKHPDREALAGWDLPHVADMPTALTRLDECGDSVAILDDVGDYASIALAVKLGEAGRAVRLFTSEARIGSRTVLTGDLPWLLPRFRDAGAVAMANAVPIAIEPGFLIVQSSLERERRRVEADTVVINMSRRSDDLPARLSEAGIEATALGDCRAPRELDEAMQEGMRFGSSVRDPLDASADSLFF